MMVSRNVLISNIVIAAVCLVLSLVCAIIRNFEPVSAILFGVVILACVIVAITCWREIVDQKKDEIN